MTAVLGIDTGGTYTDAVLLDQASGRVLALAKALTTHADLVQGIDAAVAAVLRQPEAPLPAEVVLVGLSTTLATNAIVEDRGGKVCLILIGYDRRAIESFHLEPDLAATDIVWLAGGCDHLGNETSPLDQAGLVRAVLARAERVDAFAVSGFFGVRNPVQELEARGVIASLTGRPVTCGHELTGRLDSVRRAATAALNARLTPLLRELIGTVRQSLARRGVSGRLMVVRGDGSLVRSEFALQRPIETVLSGPAASLVGAWRLAGPTAAGEDGLVWVMDMGGTTTDIALLSQGRPGLNKDGARVGRYRTMVEAVNAYTVGLGGDSQVRAGPDKEIIIGPRRVRPLCRLAAEYPAVRDYLTGLTPDRFIAASRITFLLAERQPNHGLSQAEANLRKRLETGPAARSLLEDEARQAGTWFPPLEPLLAERIVELSAFTPTDALHALGELKTWDREAARMAAAALSARLGLGADDFCRLVIAEVGRRAARHLLTKALHEEGFTPDFEAEPTAARLLDKALKPGQAGEVGCGLNLRRPLIAVGAPARAFIPFAAELLKTKLTVPPLEAVANAVGAVAGGVILRRTAYVSPLKEGRARLHLLDGVHDLPSLEEAVQLARTRLMPWMKEQAALAGAGEVEIEMTREDNRHVIGQGVAAKVLELGTVLTFIAAGRPSPGYAT
ncbi:MAG: hydantoinase/oxoprolinase family protein [Thermodesulfobacteriota bacterium]